MGIFSGVDDVLNSAKAGNFEEILSKTKSYAEDAAKKSAERLEISKKKIELLDSKTKLTKAYEKYGRLQYAVLTGEEVDSQELAACVEEIQLHKSRAELLGEEVEELKAAFMDSLSRRDVRRYERKSRQGEKGQDDSGVEAVMTVEVEFDEE